jgi:predicted SnoaL-like aldol condensation-catalyzing enzyme
MTATAEIYDYSQASSQPKGNDQLLGLLRTKNYNPIMTFLNSNYRDTFRVEQSGETFEGWIDWLAQHAGSVEDAKPVLRRFFAEFYDQLPLVAKAKLAYVADEIDYAPSIMSRLKFTDLYRVARVRITSAYGVILLCGRDFVARTRKARKPSLSVSFKAPSTKQTRRVPIDELVKSHHQPIRLR